MSPIIKIACEELAGAEINCLMVNDEPWFKGTEVAKALGYKNASKSISEKLGTEHKRQYKLLVDTCKGLDASVTQAMYITRAGVKQLLAKCQTIEGADIAKRSGMIVETKYLRKEIEIIGFVQEFLTNLDIAFEFQKRVLGFKIDLYIPDYKIAIEIDENGHSDRDPIYEQRREQHITAHLNCKFLRFNPDEPNFKISRCIATLTHHMFRT
jgi:very-short-patch-repair endonuclease